LEGARQTRREFKPPSVLGWIGHRNGQVLYGTGRISHAGRKAGDDHTASGSGGTTVTAAAGAGVGTQRYRVLRCKSRDGKSRGNLQLSAEKHESDDNTGEQDEHCWTKSIHLNYPLRQILTDDYSELSGLSRQLPAPANPLFPQSCDCGGHLRMAQVRLLPIWKLLVVGTVEEQSSSTGLETVPQVATRSNVHSKL
jgi:hypothetical protein